ncbi:hypothetical protein [Sphingobacterium sp.]|uniref:hypothetical protein n=1 Tax=Sphingobacterium sp. TaxID=341027 RepID=UPI002896F17E|nr:hypothetical protein [Sphingobacterium sp.]
MKAITILFKALLNGAIGLAVGLAFATAFSWNKWVLSIAGYILGWLLLSKGFWEGIKEETQRLEEEPTHQGKTSDKKERENNNG